MLHVGCPEEVARKGVEKLVATNTVTLRDDSITLPSFTEAQECLRSDRLRSREYRERKGQEHRSGPPPSRGVTRGSQDVTPASREITERHDESRGVTDRHSLLCSALPCSALPEGEREARVRALPPPSSAANSQSGSTALDDVSPPAPHEFTAEAQQIAFRREFERVARTAPAMGGKQVGDFHATVMRTAELQSRNPRELFMTALKTWLEKGLDERARSHPYACFCAAWGELTSTAPKPAQGPRKDTVESLRAEANAHLLAGRKEAAEGCLKRVRELQDSEERRVRYAR